MSQNAPGLIRVALTYLSMLIFGLIVMVALVWAAHTFFNIDFGNAAMGLILPMIAAMQCGALHVRKTGTRPGSSRLWAGAIVFTVIAFAVLGGLAWVNLSLAGPSLGINLNNPSDRQIVLIGAAILVALMLLTNLLGYWLGARSEVKRAEKLARRG